MNIAKEHSDDLNAVIKLTITKEDYEPRVDKVLKNYRKQATLKGFRPGKVPMNVIKQMYGNSAKADELDKLVSESLSKFITEEKLNLLGQPMPSADQKQINVEADTEFNFLFDIAVAPELEIKLSAKNKLPYYTIKVEEEVVTKQLETLRQQFGSTEQREIANENSYLKGDLVQLAEDGKAIVDGIYVENAFIALDKIKDEDTRHSFIGANKSELIDFDVLKAFENHTEIAALLHIEKEAVETLSPRFQFEITEITNFEQAKLDQEFFDKVFGAGTVTGEDEFLEKVKKDIERAYDEDSVYRFGIDAKEYLIKKNQLPLPDEFLKRWLLATDEKKELTKEKLETEYPLFADDLRWQLIRGNIAEKQKIEVTEEAMIEQSKQFTLAQFRQYGMPINSIPEDTLIEFSKKNLEREEDRRRVFETVLEKEVIKYIKNTVKLDEKELSMDDFKKLYEKQEDKK